VVDLAIFAVVLAVVAAGRQRLRVLPVTGPMIYVAAGALLGPEVAGLLHVDLDEESIVVLAEVTLALVLFSDASRIDIRAPEFSFNLPARLLLIGLPLTIALGTVFSRLILPELGWAAAALVATILAPTDAALGEAVVSNRSVPARVREALNVESGLNDGLVVPVFALFVALVIGRELDGPGSLVLEAVQEIIVGLLVGVATAVAAAFILKIATRHGLTDSTGRRLFGLATALGAFTLAGLLGGNGFLAAFACGLALRFQCGADGTEDSELAEEIGQVGAAAAFVIFGALLVPEAIEAATPAVWLCAIGALTVARMVPVAIALLGSGAKWPTVSFIGWFGPRGIASMLFGLLLATDQREAMVSSLSNQPDLLPVVSLVVLASVVLHGLTAAPLASRYGRWIAEHPEADTDMFENTPVAESRVRGQLRQPSTGG